MITLTYNNEVQDQQFLLLPSVLSGRTRDSKTMGTEQMK